MLAPSLAKLWKAACMKGLIMGVALFICTAPFYSASAQSRENATVNTSSQPSWGPRGFDYAEYYYLPDIEVYYHVPERQFIYQKGGNWIFSSALPEQHSKYDLYAGNIVVINESKAYLNFNKHKTKYSSFKGNKGTPIFFRKNTDQRSSYIDEYPGRGRLRGRN